MIHIQSSDFFAIAQPLFCHRSCHHHNTDQDLLCPTEEEIPDDDLLGSRSQFSDLVDLEISHHALWCSQPTLQRKQVSRNHREYIVPEDTI